MEYTKVHQETCDIDWFAVDKNGFIGHFASAGGEIPDTAASSIEENEKITSYMKSLPIVSELAFVKVDGAKEFISENAESAYLEDFVFYTRRGLFSFDKIAACRWDDKRYGIVAVPTTPIKIEDIPNEIAFIVSKTIFTGSFSNTQELLSTSIK